jgi:uncharacterized repeat protein (TIGR01451 family)
MYLPTPGTPPIDSIDLGLKFPASLGDFVWSDTNGNGQQDLGEPGLAGVTVSLTDGLGNPVVDFDGNPVGPTTTDGAGAYAFTNLEPGDYIVVFGTVTGYDRSPTNVGPDATDSDADQTTGQSPVVNLESGENDPTIDAGFILNSPTIDIEKFTNGQDADNAPGVIILVPNVAPIVTWTYTVTNTGNQDLINVLVTDNLEGVVGTIPFLAVGASETLTLTGTAIRGAYRNVATVVGQPIDDNGTPTGNTVTDNDPSNYTGVFINIEKIADRDEICPGEEVNFTLTLRILGGIEGIQLRAINVQDSNLPDDLMPGDANFVASSDLNNNGFVDFIDNNNDGISDEEFVWQYALSYLVTTTNEASDMAEVWYVDPITGDEFFVGNAMNMDAVTVTVNELLCASLGDFVWEDTNGNGIQDAGEPGVGGVTVNLKDENGNVIATTTTAGNGSYSFTGLTPGTYSVQFVLPGGYTYTTLGAAGSTEQNDSDADPAMNGMTAPVTLVSGENNPDLDAGLTRGASLGLEKDFLSAVLQPDGSYELTYEIRVINSGGIGQYTLTDTPGFDNDVTINSGGFSAGLAFGGGAFAGTFTPATGTQTLNTNQTIPANGTDVYQITYNVTLDLTPGSTDGGDNVYTACGTGGPRGNGMPGQGLYNLAQLDTNGDGQPDSSDDACGDLPNITMEKTALGVTANPDGTFGVSYLITVTNNGGAEGTYSLTDQAAFDDDITIIAGGFTIDRDGVVLAGNFIGDPSPLTLATNETIAAGSTHTYQIDYLASIDLSPNSTDGGDNEYTACTDPDGGNGSNPGEGLYNMASLDLNDDGIPEITDDVCLDIPSADLSLIKTVSNALVEVGEIVTFTITVRNDGPFAATGVGVEDVVPNGYSNITNISSGGAAVANVINWTGLNIPVNGQVTLTFRATVGAPGDGVDYVNLAEISTSNLYDPDSTPGNGPDTNPGNGIGSEDPDGTQDPNDEDDGDDASVNPPCMIMADFEAMPCNNNGTPANPNDDFFTVVATITGNNTGGGFTATDSRGNTFTGTYGTEITFGNYSIFGNTGEEVIITVVDNNNDNCATVIVVTTPATCSRDCALTITTPGTPRCVGGETNTPDDDRFFFSINVVGANTGNQGWRAVDQFGRVYTGNYGVNTEIGAYGFIPYAGTNIVLTIRDVQNPTCGQGTITLAVPTESCSRDCSINLTIQNIICDPMGTIWDPSDDVFYAWVLVSGENESFDGWVSDDEGVSEGDMGGSGYGLYEFGPYPISGGNHLLEIRDRLYEGCEASIMLNAPNTCSDGCLLTVTQQPAVCDDQGTSDPSDDTYTVVVRVMPQGDVSGGWRVVLGNGQFLPGGNYGEQVVLGPYLISQGPRTIKIADNQTLSCQTTFGLNIPDGPCSEACSMQAGTTNQGPCNNNGTNNTTADDYYILSYGAPNVTMPAGTQYQLLLDGQVVATNNYGNGGTIQVPANGATHTLTWRDATDNTCAATRTLPAVQPCSVPDCSMQAGTFTQGPCDDNGAPNNSNDDFYVLTYSAPVVSNPVSTQYQLLVNGTVRATRPYGQGGTIQVPANGATLTLTWRDATDPTCAASRTLPAVQPCSVPDCSMQAGTYTQGPCNDNGTPNNSNDDFYVLTYSAPVVSNPVGTQYQLLVNGVVRATRPYGQGGTIQVPANGATLTLTWRDATDPTCAASRTLPGVASCSNPCEIVFVQGPTFSYNNNGTPDDYLDDTYDMTIRVTNTGVNSGFWTITVNGQVLTYPYDQTVIVPGISANQDFSANVCDAQIPGCCRLIRHQGQSTVGNFTWYTGQQRARPGRCNGNPDGYGHGW